MKLRVKDLRPGDEFDVMELVERQGIARVCTYGGLERTNVGVVDNVGPAFDEFFDVLFYADGDRYVWRLEGNQVVEMKGWL